MIIVLLGPPGAGKGTQSKTLAKRLNLAHISTGDLLRQNVAENTPLGKQAKDFMEKGLLVPDELVTQMLIKRFGQHDLKPGFILDGYPRTINQAKALDEVLKSIKRQVKLVVYLDTSAAVIIQRLSGRLVCRKCGSNFHKSNMPPKVANVCDHCKGELYQRTDDKEETIKNRLSVYKKEVRSLIEHYQQARKLERVLADDDAPVVLEKIIELVRQKNDSVKV
ncbi:MAG: adenylate kinase [Candidatus Omnitrophota bacterium]